MSLTPSPMFTTYVNVGTVSVLNLNGRVAGFYSLILSGKPYFGQGIVRL